MPLVEIAGVLLIAPGTARSRLHYAIRVLRAALDADAREPGDLATLITDIAK
jgi:DNA-directed RNA polymerase specialized sigma24 family protein